MHFQFKSLVDFISMGGHGSYVWACYLFTVVTLVILVCWPLLKKQQLMAQIERQQRIDLNQK
jgi:heme exporter protein D